MMTNVIILMVVVIRNALIALVAIYAAATRVLFSIVITTAVMVSIYVPITKSIIYVHRKARWKPPLIQKNALFKNIQSVQIHLANPIIDWHVQ